MTDLQSVIAQANKKTRSTIARQMVKKTTDQQLLNKLTRAARAVITSYRLTVLDTYHSQKVDTLKAALAELETLTTISEKRAKS